MNVLLFLIPTQKSSVVIFKQLAKSLRVNSYSGCSCLSQYFVVDRLNFNRFIFNIFPKTSRIGGPKWPPGPPPFFVLPGQQKFPTHSQSRPIHAPKPPYPPP